MSNCLESNCRETRKYLYRNLKRCDWSCDHFKLSIQDMMLDNVKMVEKYAGENKRYQL